MSLLLLYIICTDWLKAFNILVRFYFYLYSSSSQPPEKRLKDKDTKKKKQSQVETLAVQAQAEEECRPPEPAPVFETLQEEKHDGECCFLLFIRIFRFELGVVYIHTYWPSDFFQ